MYIYIHIYISFEHPPTFKIWTIFAPFSFYLEEVLLQRLTLKGIGINTCSFKEVVIHLDIIFTATVLCGFKN